MANSQKTNGEQMANKRPNGTFAPGHKLGNRFAKGESGNSAGRPKLTRLSEALREQLSEISPDADEQTIAEQIAKTLIKLALSGDVAAIREIADRTEGKPKQAIDLDLDLQLDWRIEAQKFGLTKNDILNETKLLIAGLDFSDGDEASN
jgi:hypothetical protein